ncbi:MAG TPA: hypothetical protein VK939_17620 [Longimicrobiales bacterium]|nr:hypothetical protein [Longimicrobiales bacterium]
MDKKLHQDGPPEDRLELAAMGLESEFSLVIDEQPVRPEAVFRDPRDFIRGPLVHRKGTSYHLPTGGAIYFDTGVIELATPAIEIERGAPARAGRSLWEAVHFVRDELDAWQRQTGRTARLVGFSAHYNVSFEEPLAAERADRLAFALVHILPAPVMLLAANRRSTGVGVRPRNGRIEVTVDFTPSPALMIATATLIVGVVRDVMRWKRLELSDLERAGLPLLRGFRPVPHTSRRGWLARYDCFAQNPFSCDIDEPTWTTTTGETLSLRDIAGRITRRFWRSIRRVSDPFTFRLIGSVIAGRSPALLELPDRPAEYEDVGRLCTWEELFPPAQLSRSRYERVLIHAIAGHRLRLRGRWYLPVGMRGWSQVVCRRQDDDTRHALSIDMIARYAESWDEGAAA